MRGLSRIEFHNDDPLRRFCHVGEKTEAKSKNSLVLE
jgi:hypothetical protein